MILVAGQRVIAHGPPDGFRFDRIRERRRELFAAIDETTPYFAGDAIRVPLPPLQSVTSITYIDTAGDSQTLAASKYTVDTSSEPARIVPSFSNDWPSTRAQIDAVTVRIVAGYGVSGSDVPAPITSALLLIAAHYYEQRQPVVVGTIVADLPMAVDALLAPYRVWTFG